VETCYTTGRRTLPTTIGRRARIGGCRRHRTTTFTGRVERSLFHRANGYNYDAVKIFMPAGRDKPVYAPYIEHVPPDTTAGIFWLKNRDPQHTQQLEHVLGKYIISDTPMTAEEWARERADVLDAEASPALPELSTGRKKYS